jgi:PAS domain S-box-containing protein
MATSILRVLIIDDEESDALITRSLLETIPGAKVDTEWVSTFHDGLSRLQEHRHDVCLMDYMMGAETGVDLLRKARSLAVRTPVILLTGKGSREVDLEAMRSGAVDYLVKGEMEPEVLERAVRYAVERHRTQEELRRSEERNRGMFDHLPLGLFRVGPGGEYLEANPALIRTLDFPDRHTLREVLAKNFFVSPRDRERFLQTLEDQGLVNGFETRVQSGSGRVIRLRITARVHRGPGGKPEYVEGSVEDLTGLRSTGEVEEEAACFRVLSEVTRCGVAVADPDGHLRSVNPALASFVGEEPTALEGRGIWTLFHPADQDQLARAFEEVAAGGRDRAVRAVRLVSREGHEEEREAVLAALTGRGGSLQGLLLSLDALPVGVPDG